MSQSTYIATFLLAGFVLYLAARNRLSAYTAVLWGNTASGLPAPSVATGGSSSGGSDIGSAVKIATTAAQIFG